MTTVRAAVFLQSVALTTADGISIPSFFGMKWDIVGGWSLFIGLCLLIVVGAFREWWVPGPRYRRLETASQKQSETLATVSEALREQTQANEITKHFFEKTVPKRGEPIE
jgi:hypothetical protein